MKKRRSKKEEKDRPPGQLHVVVRVDIIIYILIAVIALLALVSVILPGQVDLAVLSGLGALVASTLTGWFTFMRLSQAGKGEKKEEEE